MTHGRWGVPTIQKGARGRSPKDVNEHHAEVSGTKRVAVPACRARAPGQATRRSGRGEPSNIPDAAQEGQGSGRDGTQGPVHTRAVNKPVRMSCRVVLSGATPVGRPAGVPLLVEQGGDAGPSGSGAWWLMGQLVGVVAGVAGHGARLKALQQGMRARGRAVGRAIARQSTITVAIITAAGLAPAQAAASALGGSMA